MKWFKFVVLMTALLIGTYVFAQDRKPDAYNADGTPFYYDDTREEGPWVFENKKQSYGLAYDWSAGPKVLYPEASRTIRGVTFTRDKYGNERLYFDGVFQFAVKDQLKDGNFLFVAFYDPYNETLAPYQVYVWIDGNLVKGEGNDNDILSRYRYKSIIFGIVTIDYFTSAFRVVEPNMVTVLRGEGDFIDGFSQSMYIVSYGSWRDMRRKEYLTHYNRTEENKANLEATIKFTYRNKEVENLWLSE